MRLVTGTRLCPAQIQRIATASSTYLSLARWRVAPVAQWHATSLFIGELPEDDLPQLLIRLPAIASRTLPITPNNGRLRQVSDHAGRKAAHAWGPFRSRTGTFGLPSVARQDDRRCPFTIRTVYATHFLGPHTRRSGAPAWRRGPSLFGPQ